MMGMKRDKKDEEDGKAISHIFISYILCCQVFVKL